MKFFEKFLDDVMRDRPNLAQYHEPTELRLSRRFGIAYEGVSTKFLIGYDFDARTKELYKTRNVRYNFSADSLDVSHIRLDVEFPDFHERRSFYFEGHKLTSPVKYYARNWARWKSEHFEFWISDTALFHHVAVEELESFLKRIGGLLKFTKDDFALLGRQKIIYVLCKDEAEIEKLTGYRSRGMYLIPYDYVTTTYSCHFHELLHFLISFKLRRLPLYTHPLLQEGFAVAFGGRGGIAPQTLLSSGAYLVKSGFVNYKELFRSDLFKQNDASLSYPVAGLYIKFLIGKLGVPAFLQLYRKYSEPSGLVERIELNDNDLPPEEMWLAYVEKQSAACPIRFSAPDAPPSPVLSNGDVSIASVGDFFHVQTNKNFALRPPEARSDYSSKRFREILPGATYGGERYLFTIDSSEAVIYDLYTNNSIASYAAGFSTPHQSVPHADDRYEFFVKKELFDGTVKVMSIVTDFSGKKNP